MKYIIVLYILLLCFESIYDIGTLYTIPFHINTRTVDAGAQIIAEAVAKNTHLKRLVSMYVCMSACMVMVVVVLIKIKL